MRHNNRIFALVLSTALTVCMLCTLSAGAFADNSVQIRFTVGQDVVPVNGNKPTADTFDYKITALDSDDPMPAGANNGVLGFKLSGRNVFRTFTVKYTHAGIYRYKVEHDLKKTVKGFTYDIAVYEVNVFVKGNPDGKLEATVVILDENGRKPDEITYIHAFSTDKIPPRTGDSFNAGLTAAACAAGALLSGSALVLCAKGKNRPKIPAGR